MAAPKARILAVDDQLYFRSFLKGLLVEEGFEVVTAGSGPQALDLLGDRGPFDLVILDPALPGCDGITMIDRIAERSPDVAVIAVSSTGDVRSVVAAMRRGAADYLLKPIDGNALLASIAEVLDGRRVRVENAQLLDENLALMGRLALLERAFPLIAREDLRDAASGVLDLMCAAVGFEAGQLWEPAPGEQGSFRLLAARGQVGEDTLAQNWVPEGEELLEALRRGQPQLLRGGGVLCVPCIVPGDPEHKLVAVAHLEADSSAYGAEPCEFGAPEIEACARFAEVAALVLANAIGRTGPEIEPDEPAPTGPEIRAADCLYDTETGLFSREFFAEALATEVRKAHRYGRRLSCICVELHCDSAQPAAYGSLVESLRGTLRTTDVLASEAGTRFWVLATDTDSQGGIVLKRRLAERLQALLPALADDAPALSLGASSFPLDGDSPDQLIEIALARAAPECHRVVHELRMAVDAPLAEISAKLLSRAESMPREFVAEVSDLLVGELSCRPSDRGLLFIAPGPDGSAVLAPLHALRDAETATEVFLATEDDTVPSGPAVTAVVMPPEAPRGLTWIVRFGETPPYALLAGPIASDGTRPVFHTSDSELVEQLTFRLRAEVGLGVSNQCAF